MTTQHELSARASRLIGRVLRDKWRLDALIGVGGMASVYAATHRNGKRVAVKLMHPEISLHEETRARFLREGYLANKVEHPGVVSVLDDDTTEDGAAFLVMELLQGDTLKARWRKAGKRLPLDEMLRITHALLDVLVAAHEKGIIHRDLKPDNIFLTTDGGVKVLDFGIARLREGSEAADVTRSTAMLGTPGFMAPEQARSRWDWVDARTDLWAVGATMFTCLSGELVHEEATAMETLLAAVSKRARPVRSVVPHLPEGVALIIDRALAYEKTERWPDARSMQAAVGAALAACATPGPPISASAPASWPYAPQRAEHASPPSSSSSSGFPAAPPSSAPSMGVMPHSRPSGAPWPATPAAAPDAGGAPSSQATVSGTANTQVAPGRPSQPRRLALAAGIGAGILVGVVIAGILWMRSGGSEAQAPAVGAPAPEVHATTAPTAGIPSVPSVTPAVDAPSASAPPPPATAAPSASASSAPSTRRDPGRAPVVPKKPTSGNPLDKY